MQLFAKLLHFCPHVHFMQLRKGKVLPNDAQQDFLRCAPIGHVGAADVELADAVGPFVACVPAVAQLF